MGKSDFSVKQKAIPFRATWWDDTGIGNRFDPDGVIISGDVEIIRTGNGVGGCIRFSRPAKGDIISAKLYMNANAAIDAPTELMFGVGTFDTDGLTAIAPDFETLARQHYIITGSDESFFYGSQANVFIDGLEFNKLIPKRGDADFNEDGWIMYIDMIIKEPTEWVLFDFKVDCLVQMGQL